MAKVRQHNDKRDEHMSRPATLPAHLGWHPVQPRSRRPTAADLALGVGLLLCLLAWLLLSH